MTKRARNRAGWLSIAGITLTAFGVLFGTGHCSMPWQTKTAAAQDAQQARATFATKAELQRLEAHHETDRKLQQELREWMAGARQDLRWIKEALKAKHQ